MTQECVQSAPRHRTPEFGGTSDAQFVGMDDPHPEPHPDEQIRDARRLVAASRQLKKRAREHVETAKVQLDRARNVLQVRVLMRALSERRRGQRS